MSTGIPIDSLSVAIPWLIIGFGGVGCLGVRWLVQVTASRKKGRSVVPLHFWWLSVAGSLLLLAYFSLGRPDVIGIITNVCALTVAMYNLRLHQSSAAARSTVPSSVGANRPSQ